MDDTATMLTIITGSLILSSLLLFIYAIYTRQYHRIKEQLQNLAQESEQLRRIAERFTLALQGANDGLWDWNLETDEAYFSPRWKCMLGYTNEELNNHFDEWHKRLHPEEFDQVMLSIDAYLGKKVPTYEYTHRMQHRESYYIWVLVRGIALWNEQGAPLRFVGTYVDITAQKQTEKALRNSEEYTRMLIKEAQVGLILIQADGLIVEANPAFAQTLGYKVQEVVGQLNYKNIILQQSIHLAGIHQSVLETRGRYGPVEGHLTHKTGHPIPVRISGLVLNKNQEQFIWVNIEDISDLERAKVAEQAKLKAELASQAKSTFLANMSHELRTPLNIVLGYAQNLERDKMLTAKQREDIDAIHCSGKYLLKLINDVLDITEIETGQVKLCPTDFHLGTFLEDIVKLFQMQAQRKNLSFTFNPLSSLPLGIHADEKRLRQILTRLLDNAIKFTQQGGIVFSVHYYQGKMLFQIEDTGVGIEESELNTIFLPFQQESEENFYKVEGLGLGLPLVKHLVKMMEGDIHVASAVNQGSTFWITLKILEVSEIIQAHFEQHNIIVGYTGKPRKILVVDDLQASFLILEHLLCPLGFLLYHATNGEEAVSAVTEFYPDLVLMDLVMPVMDGFKATLFIRELSGFETLPIIAMSVSVFNYRKEACAGSGFNDFIAKPIKKEEILTLLQQHLQLTWIYEQDFTQSRKQNAIMQNAEQTRIIEIVPSPEEVSIINDLILRGDFHGIIHYSEELTKLNPALQPFMEDLHQLAKHFDEDGILTLLKPLS